MPYNKRLLRAWIYSWIKYCLLRHCLVIYTQYLDSPAFSTEFQQRIISDCKKIVKMQWHKKTLIHFRFRLCPRLQWGISFLAKTNRQNALLNKQKNIPYRFMWSLAYSRKTCYWKLNKNPFSLYVLLMAFWYSGLEKMYVFCNAEWLPESNLDGSIVLKIL